MGLLRVNNFSDISSYAHALDLFFVVAFLFSLVYAIRRFKQGERIYLVLFITAIFYGFVLEVSGMLWHASYTQGEFWLMWDFRQFEAFKDSTDMPFYVPLFYPVWLMTAYKLMEPLGIKNLAARSVAVGLACLTLDVPYILIAPHVGWWEWHEWQLYQLWLGWPLLDGLWELTWHAFLAWCLLKLMPRINAYYDKQDAKACVKALLGWPLAIALIVNIAGPLLMIPASVPTTMMEGFRHYPIVVLYVVIAITIFLFAEKEVRGQYLAGRDLFLPLLHFIVFVTMTLFRIGAEGGFKDYILVQSVALYASAMMMVYPRYMAKRK